MGPLAGYTIGITAARRREEFGAALERRGAKVVYAPAIKIVPLADDSELRDATAALPRRAAGHRHRTTGIGFRGWIDAADTWGLAERLTAAIDRSTVLARGPKARGAIRACGLREAWSPESESSSEVLAHLIAACDLEGKRIAVQLHGEPLPDVVQTLRLAGAEVIEVPVYRWVPPEDAAPLRPADPVGQRRRLDAVAFTSAPAAASFLRAADEQGCGERRARRPARPGRGRLRRARDRRPLPAGGHPGDPARPQPPGRPGQGDRRADPAAPRTAAARGRPHDGRARARRRGGRQAGPADRREHGPAAGTERQARPRRLPRPAAEDHAGDGGGEHAVEVAVGRLRTALGDPRIIQTVVKRGYRLAYEPERAGNHDGSWRYCRPRRLAGAPAQTPARRRARLAAGRPARSRPRRSA